MGTTKKGIEMRICEGLLTKVLDRAERGWTRLTFYCKNVRQQSWYSGWSKWFASKVGVILYETGNSAER